jgi:ABC-type oligopeptide transport system ATPase subunit
MSGDLLTVDHISKFYSTGGMFGRAMFRALDDVSFCLAAKRPEIFAIIGESGSGKTTLARIILKILAPTSGTITSTGLIFRRYTGDETASNSWAMCNQYSKIRSRPLIR